MIQKVAFWTKAGEKENEQQQKHSHIDSINEEKKIVPFLSYTRSVLFKKCYL